MYIHVGPWQAAGPTPSPRSTEDGWNAGGACGFRPVAPQRTELGKRVFTTFEKLEPQR